MRKTDLVDTYIAQVMLHVPNSTHALSSYLMNRFDTFPAPARVSLLVLTLCLCMIAWGDSAASAQGFKLGKIGVAGGVSLQQVDNLGTTASFENATGYNVGVFYDQPLDALVGLPTGKLAVRTGAVLRRIGSYEFTALEDRSQDQLLGGASFNIYAFDVPLDVRYQYDDLSVTEPYVFVGPQVSILRAEQDFDNTLNDLVFSANVGLGSEFEIPAAFGLTVAPELMYTFGITDAVKGDFTYRFRQIETAGPSFSGFSARVHVYLPF